jgi:phosphatidylglycerophosphatase A
MNEASTPEPAPNSGDPGASGVPPQPQAAPAAPAAAPRRASARFMLSHIGHFIALGFGSGLSPVAPGTVGTLYAWLSFLVLDPWLSAKQWGLLIALSFIAGIGLCGRTARALGTDDPSAVVWDEIVAFWFVLWLLMPAGLWAQAAAFALFRLFDAVKRGPVGWADRRFKGGFGIMFDDAVAAGLALFVIALARRIW